MEGGRGCGKDRLGWLGEVGSKVPFTTWREGINDDDNTFYILTYHSVQKSLQDC